LVKKGAAIWHRRAFLVCPTQLFFKIKNSLNIKKAYLLRWAFCFHQFQNIIFD